MILVGVDEAGRGPLAGRVYAACCILDPKRPIPELNDSKKLTDRKRSLLYDRIREDALGSAIAFAEVEEIDSLNILQAAFLAMERSLEQVGISFDTVLVDGNQFPFSNKYQGEAVVKGDSKIPEIMAASILAKVERDRYMIEMHSKYPRYNFDKHKGYPTKEHRELLQQYGPCPIHRTSFKPVQDAKRLF